LEHRIPPQYANGIFRQISSTPHQPTRLRVAHVCHNQSVTFPTVMERLSHPLVPLCWDKHPITISKEVNLKSMTWFLFYY